MRQVMRRGAVVVIVAVCGVAAGQSLAMAADRVDGRQLGESIRGTVRDTLGETKPGAARGEALRSGTLGHSIQGVVRERVEAQRGGGLGPSIRSTVRDTVGQTSPGVARGEALRGGTLGRSIQNTVRDSAIQPRR